MSETLCCVAKHIFPTVSLIKAHHAHLGLLDRGFDSYLEEGSVPEIIYEVFSLASYPKEYYHMSEGLEVSV
jgi:hypothetical protein